MSEPNKGDQPKVDEQPKSDPDGSQSGESPKKEAEAPSNIPQNLQGRSQDELIKMYGELERKLGEQSASVKEAREIRKNQELLAKAIYSDPDLVKRVDTAIKRQTGQAADEKQGGEDDGEANEELADLRRANENRIVSDFTQKYGIDSLDSEEKQKVLQQVGSELADMVDPSGKKPMTEVLNSISLEKLPALLEKAYFLSNMDSLVQGDASKVQPQNMASIGRMSSSSPQSEGQSAELSSDETRVAKMLGVDPDKYKEQKKKINS